MTLTSVLKVLVYYPAGSQDWNWGGCSDNVGFGEQISKQYIDEMESGNDARAVVNLHNNEAGRRVSDRLNSQLSPIVML